MRLIILAALMVAFFMPAYATEQDRTTFQSSVTSTVTDGGALTAAELRTILNNLSDSSVFKTGNDIGADTQILFNDAGTISAVSGFAFNSSTGAISSNIITLDNALGSSGDAIFDVISSQDRDFEIREPSGGNATPWEIAVTNAIDLTVDETPVIRIDADGDIQLDATNDTRITGSLITPDNTNLTVSPAGSGVFDVTTQVKFSSYGGGNITGTAASCAAFDSSGNLIEESCGGGGSVAGADGQIQYNDSGSFAGDANFTFDSSTGSITLGAYGSNSITGTVAQLLGVTSSGLLVETSNNSAVYNAFSASDTVIIDVTATSAAASDNTVVIGKGLTAGVFGGDEIVAIGSSDGTTTDSNAHTVDGNAAVMIGRNNHLDCTNGVLIGDSSALTCGGVTDKSQFLGNDSYLYNMDHFYGFGSNLRSTGCQDCGMWGEDITNNQDGSFAIAATGATTTVATPNTLWTELYIHPLEVTTGSLQTCNSNSEGLIVYDTSEDKIAYCNATQWVYTGNAIAVSETTAATYSFVLADAGNYREFNRGTAQTVTVPPNSSIAFPIGSVITFVQSGAGQVTIAQGSGVTVNTPETLKLRAQHSPGALIKVGTDEWNLHGDLEAAP